MRGLTLITPTSDRPVAFQLCQRWMQRAIEEYRPGPVQWIVADDGQHPCRCTLGQLHLRRPPSSGARESFLGNLLAALEHVEHDRVLFIEDDDWYAATYLCRMSEWMTEDVLLAGEARSKYYNLETRRYQQCRNRMHASLCQTGMHAELVPWLMRHLRRSCTSFVDLELWKSGSAESARRLQPCSVHCVGIKGLPGKSGLGIGHRLGVKRPRDRDGSVLRNWIGDDADVYLDL